jgi:hypothetical protein
MFYNGTSTFLAYGGNNRFTFPSSGNLTIQGDAPAKPTAGGWVTSCDIRIKDDVRDYTRGLEEILQLRPVSYRHKAETGFDSTKIRYGMVAQECEEIMPELVTVEPRRSADSSQEEEAVSLIGLLGVLAIIVIVIVVAMYLLNQVNMDPEIRKIVNIGLVVVCAIVVIWVIAAMTGVGGLRTPLIINP